MTRAIVLALIFTSLAASSALADDAAAARGMARKDYEAAVEKIRSDDAAATERCRSKTGPAAEACLIQVRGKRIRAEEEAKTNLDRTGQTAPLPDAQAKNASRNALNVAQIRQRSSEKAIEAEAKAAGAECKKLSGAARKTCTIEVAERRQEALDVADAMYKKARSDAKRLIPP